MQHRPRSIPRAFAIILCFSAACALYVAAGLVERRASAEGAPQFNGRIAFVSSRNGPPGEIYSMNPDGSDQRNLTNSAESEVCPAFSPDGKRIAFLRNWNSLWMMNADGGGQTLLLDSERDGFASLMCADWSPDGKTIAFSGIPKGSQNGNDIYVIGVDGSGLKRLTTDPADDSTPRWSPDGTRIAFSSIRDRVPGEVNYEIYVMGADGSNQTRLTDNPEQDSDAEWSPDGKAIAFTSSREGRFGEIYSMTPEGTNLVNLTNADFFDMDPSWQRVSSPLGTPTPTPTPTTNPGPSDTTEVWEPYVPKAVQTELTVLSCGGRTFAKVKFTFNDGGYRVVDWGQAEQSGNDFAADVKAEHWTGITIQVITFAEKVYDLGSLAPGTYTFTLRSRGGFVKSTSFVVGSTASNPTDDATVFVAQHYLDFLGRDPDQPGLGFWTRNMTTTCGADAACIERKRVDTSAAFFLSIEFQRTGFLVHRLYRAAYGRMPRRDEFLADARQMSHGVVVGTQGWEALLASNTSAFIDEWVTRPQFRFDFDQLTDEQFVERLYKNAGLAAAPNAGNSLVADLAAGRITRAQALRSVAEDETFSKKELAPAFVLMQYFGYLQRNPDEGRDANWDGYNYWLAKLNQFGGDHVRAEMVKAFINSTEYRERFCGQ
ncbi:MAG: TolB protein [Acidobacteriota bacterium]|jgi:TolB protein|nr:TolB protein [Acidobacteriota bacterium]